MEHLNQANLRYLQTSLLAKICGTNKLDEPRIQIYRNNWLAAAHRQLRQVYPAIAVLLGEKYFQQTSNQYVKQHPSQGFNLLEFGEYFAKFISHLPGLDSYPYLGDVARLEWLIYRCSKEVPTTAIELQQLYQLLPEQLANVRFLLPNKAELLASEFPVDTIWNAAQKHQLTDVNKFRVYIFVWVKNGDLKLDRLTKTEYELLNLIGEDMPFHLVCEQLGVDFPITATLTSIVTKGYIARFIC